MSNFFENITIAIPPGETLKEYLVNFKKTKEELADQLNITVKYLNKIINGKANIDNEFALKLESVTGMHASFWTNLEAKYQEALLNKKKRRKKCKNLKIFGFGFYLKSTINDTCIGIGNDIEIIEFAVNETKIKQEHTNHEKN